MKLCQECGTPLTGRQKQFCSVICRNRPNGRKTGGWNKQSHTKICENCGVAFPLPAWRLEIARACSRRCLGELQSRERKGKFMGPENPTWKGGIQTYRRHRKNACEQCGATGKLYVHHKDENRYNNELSNLETLCPRCHLIHHRCADHLPKGQRPWNKPLERACEGCGKHFQPKGRQRFCTQKCWLATWNDAQSKQLDVPAPQP